MHTMLAREAVVVTQDGNTELYILVFSRRA